MKPSSPTNDESTLRKATQLGALSEYRGYLIGGCAFVVPILSGMLFLLRNYLATEGEVTPPLDDTLIYFQYARTFTEGTPFGWLPSGGYSTGATSYLYVLLLAAGYALGANGPWLYAVAWLLGILFFAISLWRLGLWMERSFGLLAAVGGIVMAGTCGLVLWCAHSGMDSMLLLLAVTLAAEAVARMRGEEKHNLLLYAVCFGLLPLIRPEAGVLGCVLSLCLLPGRKGRGVKQAITLFSACAATILVLAAINYVLTGTTASNGVVTKSWMTDPSKLFFERLAMVLVEAGTFLSRFALPDHAPERALLIPLFVFGSWRLWKGDDQGWLLTIVVVMGIGLTLQSSYANVHRNRYQAPFLAIALMVAGAAFVYGATYVAERRGLRGIIAGIVALIILGFSGVRDANAWAWRFALDARDIKRHTVAMGQWIGKNVAPDAVVALHDAGGMPYYSGHPRFLDLVGLGTNGMGRWYRSGPGALYERLESLPSQARPNFYAVYTDWFEDVDILGPVRHAITLERVSIVPNPVLHVLEARSDRFGLGHQPWLSKVNPSAVVDAVDFADLDSEAAHGFDHGSRPGITRYMRGRTPYDVVAGDGARWLRGEVEFTLNTGSPSENPGAPRLVLRLAAGTGTELSYRVEGGDEGKLKVDQGASLKDYLVELPGASGMSALKIHISPEAGEDIFLARAYVFRGMTTP